MTKPAIRTLHLSDHTYTYYLVSFLEPSAIVKARSN